MTFATASVEEDLKRGQGKSLSFYGFLKLIDGEKAIPNEEFCLRRGIYRIREPFRVHLYQVVGVFVPHVHAPAHGGEQERQQ